MAVVITLNQIKNFPTQFDRTIVAKDISSIDGESIEAETKIYQTDSDIDGFRKYKMIHEQKYKIEGKMWGREFSAIMRKHNINVYCKDGLNYAITVGNMRGTSSTIAFRRLHSRTVIKCCSPQIDLIKTIDKILHDSTGVRVNMGWFTNLKLPNLNNVLLQGDEVNDGPDWERYKTSKGSQLANVELIVEDKDLGQVIISLSKRGFLLCKQNLSVKKSLEITQKIIKLIA